MLSPISFDRNSSELRFTSLSWPIACIVQQFFFQWVWAFSIFTSISKTFSKRHKQQYIIPSGNSLSESNIRTGSVTVAVNKSVHVCTRFTKSNRPSVAESRASVATILSKAFMLGLFWKCLQDFNKFSILASWRGCRRWRGAASACDRGRGARRPGKLLSSHFWRQGVCKSEQRSFPIG